MGKKKVAKDGSDAEDEVETVKSASGAKKAEKGWNYTAIFFMILFILPGFVAVVLQVRSDCVVCTCFYTFNIFLNEYLQGYDMMYPEAKAQRIVRERVIKCYEAANPTKLNEVDKIIEKYKGREHALFAQLRSKYAKHPEC